MSCAAGDHFDRADVVEVAEAADDRAVPSFAELLELLLVLRDPEVREPLHPHLALSFEVDRIALCVVDLLLTVVFEAVL